MIIIIGNLTTLTDSAASEVTEWGAYKRSWQFSLLFTGFFVAYCLSAFVCVNWSSNSGDYITSQSTERETLFADHCNASDVSICASRRYVFVPLVATVQPDGLPKKG